MDVINIQQKFDLFTDRWSPKRIGELNGQQVILAKIQGEFVFHKHDDEELARIHHHGGGLFVVPF